MKELKLTLEKISMASLLENFEKLRLSKTDIVANHYYDTQEEDNNPFEYDSISDFICRAINNSVKERICTGKTVWNGESGHSSFIKVNLKQGEPLYLAIDTDNETFEQLLEQIHIMVQKLLTNEFRNYEDEEGFCFGIVQNAFWSRFFNEL